VDHLGGFEVALELVRRKLEPEHARLEPELISAVHWPPRRGLIPRFALAGSLANGAIFGSLSPWAALIVASVARRERGYLWCSCAETDLGG
jgi:hypothetical protein